MDCWTLSRFWPVPCDNVCIEAAFEGTSRGAFPCCLIYPHTLDPLSLFWDWYIAERDTAEAGLSESFLLLDDKPDELWYNLSLFPRVACVIKSNCCMLAFPIAGDAHDAQMIIWKNHTSVIPWQQRA